MDDPLGIENILPYKAEGINTQNVLMTFLVVTSIIWYCKYVWSRRKLYYYSSEVPGPFSVPILGTGYKFIGKNANEIINIIMDEQKKYPGICKMWMGPRLVYLLSEPKYIDTVLNSPNALNKDDSYILFTNILGEGLVTAPGPKWKVHRKAVSPSFSKKKLETFVEIFVRKGQIFAEKIEKQIGKKNVNYYPMAVDLTLDIVCETAMGINMKIQTENKDNLGQSIEIVMHIGNERIFKVYYQIPIVWYFSALKKLYDEYVPKLWKYCNEMINMKMEMLKKQKPRNNNSYMDDGNGSDDETVKESALMDRLMIQNLFSHEDLKATLQTFIGAATETTASALCVVLTCLGIYQDIQQNVYQEVIDLLGPDRIVEAEDITQMSYTDRVIKEALRLFPIAPIFSRKPTDIVDLGDYKLPPDCNITINSIYNHRSPLYFKDPLKFDPDRFLPEELGKRHPCAYIPFSTGPRNCIGARYAMLNLKTHLTILLRKFKIFSDYKSIEDIELDLHTLLRFKEGYKLRFEKR